MSTIRLSSQERRAAIIEAAIKLFSEKGFRGTTTRELASVVGVSEPVLYQHFTTKRDLYNAILEQLATADETAVPATLPLPSEVSDDRQFLTALANGIVDWHRKHPAYVRLLILAAVEGHEFNDIFYERYVKSCCDRMSLYFATRMDQGVFRRTDPELATQGFFWLFGHYALDLTLFRKTEFRLSQQQTIEGLIDMYLKGLQA